MGKKQFMLIALCCCMLAVQTLQAQVSSGKTSLDKNSAKGLYGGAYVLNNGNVALFYQHKEGISAFEFNAKSQFQKALHGNEANGLLDQTMQTATTNALADFKEYKNLEVLFVASSWGALKLQKGILGLKSDNKFIYGMDYEKLEDRKLKAEDTWRTTVIGNRAIIPADHRTVKFRAENGHHMRYDFKPTGISSMAPINGAIQSVGVITEKVSIKDPSSNHFNRLVIFTVGGKSMDESSNIHTMPYAMQGVGSGISARGNFMALTMPLNAPTTVKEQREKLASDEDKNNVYLYEIDENNQVVAEVMYKSDLRTVNFQTVAAGNKTIVIGTGAEGKNWRMAYMGQTAMSGVSIAVLDADGQLLGAKSYTDKDFAGKYENVGESKAKPQKFTGGPNFYQAETLENGNIFVLGKSDGFHHGILLSSSNELIRYYVFPHADVSKHVYYTHQLKVKGNTIALVNSDQPHELSNAVNESSSTSKYTTGNLNVTRTSTSKTQLFEIFHVSQLFTIDGTSGKSDLKVLSDIQKGFNSMGNTPALFTDQAIYFPGRIKAPKGKELALIRIEY